MALFDPQVNIVGNTKGVQTTIERLASKAKRMQENYLSDDIMDAVLQKIRKLGEQKPSFNTKGMDKEMKKGMKILEKITKVDADNVINKVAGEAVSTGYSDSFCITKLSKFRGTWRTFGKSEEGIECNT